MTKYICKNLRRWTEMKRKEYGTEPKTMKRIESKPVDINRNKRGNNYSSSSLGSPTPSS